jgi:pilus assembly protein CpaE
MTTLHSIQSPFYFSELIGKQAKIPASRSTVMAFITDPESEASVREGLSPTWFPEPKIMRGGIVRAIRHLSTERSPNILIVDISDIEMPVSRVDELAEVCEPGVIVIAVGKRNDVGLYRDLMQAGITEYLVKPITSELLAKALSPKPTGGEVTPIHQKLGKMVAVVGARGGVGATTLAVNLAWYLASRHRRRVALVDLDLQNGHCALELNLKSNPGLREALTNPRRVDRLFLERVMVTHDERLFVLSSEEPLRDDVEFSAEAVELLLTALRVEFHYVIVDIPRFTAAPYRVAMDRADRRIIVGDRTMRSVRDIARLYAELGGSEAAAHRNLLVINRSGEGGGKEVTLDEIFDNISVRPKIVIPFQPKCFSAAAFSARVVVARAGKFSVAVASLAAEISGRMREHRPWWKRIT